MNKNTTHKRVVSLLLAVMMLIGLVPASVTTAFAQDDSIVADISWYESNPNATEYEISTAAQLLGFATLANSTSGYGAKFAGKTFKLTADINLNPTWTASSTKPTNVWPNANEDYFQGTFDGQGHTISGLYVSSSTLNNMGMFVGAMGNAVIKNFALVNSYFGQTGGKDRLAAICPSMGTNGKVTIENVYVDAIVDGCNSAGGILGTLKDTGSSAIVKGCVFAGTVTGKNFVGGIVANGNGKTLTIEDCLNLGSVSGTEYIGGILGRNDAGATVTNCVNMGRLSKSSSVVTYSGSIVGYASTSGTISNCYYTADGWDRVTGTSTKATVSDCALIEQADMVSTLSGNANFANWAQVGSYAISVPSYFVGSDAQTSMKDAVEERVKNYLQPRVTADKSWYTGNTGATEYEISTPAQLLGLAAIMNNDSVNFSGKTIKLTADIDMNPNWDASTGEEPTNVWINTNGANFAGTFDGQGHTVSGLYLRSGINNVGMFVGSNGGTIKNFALLNSYFEQTGGARLAAICPAISANKTATIENVYTDAILVSTTTTTGKNSGVGGIVASLNNTSASVNISGCVFAGTITSTNVDRVGGIMGDGSNNGGTLTVTDCVNMGTINSKCGGGIVGRSDVTTTITRCVNLGTINYTGSHGWSGDLFGAASTGGVATLSDCYYIGATMKNGEREDYVANKQNDATVTGMSTKVSLGNTATTLKNNSAFSAWVTVGAHAFPQYVANTFGTLIGEKATGLAVNKVDILSYTGNEPVGTVFTISSVEALLHASRLSMSGVTFSGYTLMLGADIDLNPGWDATVSIISNVATLPEIPDTAFAGFDEFRGIFDGQNHTIRGIFMAESMLPDSANLALFRKSFKASVINLKVANSFIFGDMATNRETGSEVSGKSFAGIFANNQAGDASIENCYLDMQIWYRGYSANTVGGVIAKNDNPVLVKNVVFQGTLGNMTPGNAVPSTTTSYYMGALIANNNGKANVFVNCTTNGVTYWGADGENKKVAVGGTTTNATITNVDSSATMTAASAAAGWSFNVLPSATEDSNTPNYGEGTQSVVYYYSSITEADFNTYLTNLENAGYTVVYTNTVDGNRFAQYENGVYQVYASYIKDTAKSSYRARVAVSTYTGNFATEVETGAAGTVAEKLWQLNVDNWNSKQAGGMGYIIRLSDGRFVIIDGGYKSSYDAANIYKILIENNVLDSKPVVAAWFITHAHDDHFGALARFAEHYAEDIIVEGFYGNFPPETLTPSSGDTLEIGNVYLTKLAMTAFRDQEGLAPAFYEIHSGMQLAFANTTALVLCTQEDARQSYYAKKYSWSSSYTLTKNDFTDGNDTSLVMQFTIGGQKIMITGDASGAASNALLSTWSTSQLKSDIVQVSHHGFDGLSEAFYQAVAAPVALWPQDLVVYSDQSGTIAAMNNSGSGDNSFYYLYAHNSGREANVWLKENTKEVIPSFENACLALPYVTGTYTGLSNMDSNSTAAQNYFTAKYKEKSGLDNVNGGTSSSTALLDGAGGSRTDYVLAQLIQKTVVGTDGTFDAVFAVAFSGSLAEYESYGLELIFTRGSDGASASFNKATGTVYRTITVWGQQISASEHGQEYIFAVAYNGMPVDDAFTVTVKPYHVDDNGEKVYIGTAMSTIELEAVTSNS